MAITKPKRTEESQKIDAEQYINAAPDSAAFKQKASKKTQITLTIKPELLQKIDQKADRQGMSRAGLINLAIFNLLESDSK